MTEFLSRVRYRIPRDPSAETEHLNPDGTHKHRRVDRPAQEERFHHERKQSGAHDTDDPIIPKAETPVRRRRFWWEEPDN